MVAKSWLKLENQELDCGNANPYYYFLQERDKEAFPKFFFVFETRSWSKISDEMPNYLRYSYSYNLWQLIIKKIVQFSEVFDLFILMQKMH